MKGQYRSILAAISLLYLGLTAVVVGHNITAAADAAAPTGQPSNETPGVLSGAGIIHYDTSKLPPIANSRMIIIQGTKDANGICHYRTEFSSPNGDTRPQTAQLVAVDPVTCRFQMERGTPTVIDKNPTGGSRASSTASAKGK